MVQHKDRIIGLVQVVWTQILLRILKLANLSTNGGETIRRMRETIVGQLLLLGGFMNNNNAERTCFYKEESNQRLLLQQRPIIHGGHIPSRYLIREWV